MNPSNQHYEPSPELPRTDSENVGLVSGEDLNGRLNAEKSSRVSELTTSSSQPITQMSTAVPAIPPPLVNDSGTAQQNQPQIDVPESAMDEDLIETEWINRAKAIVEKTREDPHVQNREMNKMKAAYIEKRYNKHIKVDEE